MSPLAFHGNPATKQHYLDKAEFHEWTDAYAKGHYWDPLKRRGCAVGCWSHDPYGGHGSLARDMGVPEELLRLADGIFEALPEAECKVWPRRFADAIAPGADLGGIWALMLQWMLFDGHWGLAALGRRGGLDPVFNDVESYFDWKAEGLEVPTVLEHHLDESVAKMVDALSHWHLWEEFAKEHVRAKKALTQVWRARNNAPKDLDQAAWACRAAWFATESYTFAQAETLLAFLRDAPVLIERP